MAIHSPTYCYRVDADDRIVWVDQWWIAFAQENGASELSEQVVLGELLWDFVEGDEICTLYAAIHEQVRESGKTAVLPFRCDSPSLQRHMRLTIARQQDESQLKYECQLLRVEPQKYVELLDSAIPRSESVLSICSCCKQGLLEPLGWMDVEEISVLLRIFETQQVPELRHVVCPSCADELYDRLDNGNAA